VPATSARQPRSSWQALIVAMNVSLNVRVD
jgi:hypothetical protein